MSISEKGFYKIKNLPRFSLPRDFGYNVFSYLVLILFLGAAITVQTLLVGPIQPVKLVIVAVSTLFAAGILTKVPMWSVVIQFIAIAWISLYAGFGGNFYPLFALITAGLIISPAFQLVQHWDKVVILRLGKFRKSHGPGLFLLFPLIDRITAFVDTRIRATDFSAEKTLTRDTVPVNVDALAFWMIWDARKAVLEVENFMEAVVLSAQTALRDAIGKHELAELLSERDKLGREIQTILDAKTNAWGITILSIEFTDIIIPRELEDAMSRQAQAERERQSRVILGTAEVEVAEKFEKAAEKYKDNPTALHLRAMNMVYEGIRKNGSIMLLPSSALESMSLGTVLGTAALAKGRNTLQGDAPAEDKHTTGEDSGDR